MVRGTFSPARAWRPAVVARLARTLGRAGQRVWYSTRSFVPRHARSSRSGEVLQDQFVVASRVGSALASDARAGTRASGIHVLLCSQFFKAAHERGQRFRQSSRTQVQRLRPSIRLTRSGNAGFAQTCAAATCKIAGPHSGQDQEARAPTLQRPDAARPNPSLNRTRYGKRRKPGLRHMVHHLSPGLRRLPPQAG